MYMITCVVQAFLCFTMYSLTDAKFMYVIWIVLSFVGEAAHFVLFPAVCSLLYGAKLGSAVYSFLYFARPLAAYTGILASSVIQPRLGWLACYIFFGALTVVSFVLLLFFNAKPLPPKSLRGKRGNASPDTSFGATTT